MVAIGKAEINRKLDVLEEKKKAGEISQSEYEKECKNWDNLNLGLSIVSGALLVPTDSALGIAASAASPKVTQKIGKLFKEGGALHKHEGKPLHGIAQGVWAAAVAYAGGNNALAAGISAGGSELAVPVLSNWLYREKDGSKLDAEQKQTVSAILGTLNAGGTAVSGGSEASVVATGQAGANAVENNYIVLPSKEINKNLLI